MAIAETEARAVKNEARSFLVYGAGANQIPVLQAARKAGYRVIGIDRNPEAPGRPLTDRFLTTSLSDHQSIERALREEKLFGVAARIADPNGLVSAFQIARTRGLSAPSPSLVEVATRKTVLASHCAKHGLPTPERVDAAASCSPESPLLVRPDVSIRGKAAIRRVTTIADLESATREASRASANGSVDRSRWIDGTDLSVLLHLDCGLATRVADWDEWVALDSEGRIRGVGCATPSTYHRAAFAIDPLLASIASSFPESRGLIAVSLRIDTRGCPFVIEIHLGIGGDDIADQLLTQPRRDTNIFDLLIRSQAGEPIGQLVRTSPPRALLRDAGQGWRRVDAPNVAALLDHVRTTLPNDWTWPRPLQPESIS